MTYNRELHSNYIGTGQIPLELCKIIVQEMKDNDHKGKVDSSRGYTRLNNRCLKESTHKSYMTELAKIKMGYKQEFPWCRRTEPWDIVIPYNLQTFYPGDCYSQEHIEERGPRTDRPLRHLTFMTYLNSIEDGGETHFLTPDIKIKPKEGLTIIWPAGWTHPHRGHPSKNTKKRIITGWYAYKHKC